MPTVTIDDPDSGTDAAIGSAVMDSAPDDDKVLSITFTGGASGYSLAPSVTVDSGPHLIRITSGANEGRFFRIESNTATTVTISADFLDGESLTGTNAFNAGGNDAIEIIRATTLADVFGAEAIDVELDTGGIPSHADWIFLWDEARKNYSPFFFKDDSVRNSPGWYKNNDRRFRRPANDEVLYPDQAFIICRRTANAINPEFEGVVQITDTRLRLPAADEHFLTTNPFGGDVFLTELISAKNIGKTATQFWPADADENGDNIYVLSSSGGWKTYFHSDAANANISVSRQAICTAIRLSGGSGGQVASAYLAYPPNPNSLNPAHKTSIVGVTNPAPGAGNMTITTGAAHGLQAGDILRIQGVKGYKTNETNTKFIQKGSVGAELDMINANRNPTITRVIESAANGTWKVLTIPDDNGNGEDDEFTIGKSGNCEFIAGGTGYWRTGAGGLGYTADAQVYFIGNGANDAVGTANVNVATGKVTSITMTNNGSGYGTETPQAVFSSGGWRISTSPIAPDQGNTIIPAGAGILIYRHAGHSGALTYLKAANPTKLTKDN